MPYFVYKVFAPRRLQQVECFDNYREARTLARTLRSELGDAGEPTIRVIFADNSDAAEGLLLETREPRPLGEE